MCRSCSGVYPIGDVASEFLGLPRGECWTYGWLLNYISEFMVWYYLNTSDPPQSDHGWWGAERNGDFIRYVNNTCPHVRELLDAVRPSATVSDLNDHVWAHAGSKMALYNHAIEAVSQRGFRRVGLEELQFRSFLPPLIVMSANGIANQIPIWVGRKKFYGAGPLPAGLDARFFEIVPPPASTTD